MSSGNVSWGNRLSPETLAILGDKLEENMAKFSKGHCRFKDIDATDDLTCADIGCELLGPGGCTHPEHPVNKFKNGGYK